jgi:mRNA interferase MazF
VNRGEVYWYRFRSPDKRRPVVILTRTESLAHLSSATVAGLTTTVRHVASQVPVGPEHGVPRHGAVNLHQIFTVEQSALGPRLTALPSDMMAAIDLALVFALGVGEGDEPASLQ